MSDEEQRRTILARLGQLDTATLKRLGAMVADGPDHASGGGKSYLDFLAAVVQSDVAFLRKAEQSYGDSWKRRGGVDTYHMLTRKWDRVEKRAATPLSASGTAAAASPYDVFEHIAADPSADGFIDDIRDLRRYLMLIEAEITSRKARKVADSGSGFLDYLEPVAASDVATIQDKEKSYGSSWKRRGGIAAFMMLARKWDRIEQRVATHIDAKDGAPGAARDNVLEHIQADRRAEGVLDDVRDLRRFLILVEAEMAARGVLPIGKA